MGVEKVRKYLQRASLVCFSLAACHGVAFAVINIAEYLEKLWRARPYCPTIFLCTFLCLLAYIYYMFLSV
jgi:hypothetical protein